MGIFDKDFEKAIGSTEAAFLRGKMGTDKGNKFIQDNWNKVHAGSNWRKCGFDNPKYGNNNR